MLKVGVGIAATCRKGAVRADVIVQSFGHKKFRNKYLSHSIKQ